MRFIKNFDQLATTAERKVVLELIETALSSIQSEMVMEKNFNLVGSSLLIADQTFDLSTFEKVVLLGFGKGSAHISQLVEQALGDKLTEGYCIDVTSAQFKKIQFTLGTHPLPSEANYTFTQMIMQKLSRLSEKTLVLVVICGGGSAMLVAPHEGVSLEQKIAVNKALLQSGANIIEMNTVRKHLSAVKGGGLARILYPATVASLIFSDVPGNDLAFIASGPTVKDKTFANDAIELVVKYNILEKITVKKTDFSETPKDDKYFARVHNILMLSNRTALSAMNEKAKDLGYETIVLSDKFQGNAKLVGKQLLEQTPQGKILLVAGETTVKVAGKGRGGRNQALVLAALPYITDQSIIASFDSDGWDFDTLAGALADTQTAQKAQDKHLSVEEYLNDDDSLAFFQQVGDGIDTGRLPSNVADLMIVFKK